MNASHPLIPLAQPWVVGLGQQCNISLSGPLYRALTHGGRMLLPSLVLVRAHVPQLPIFDPTHGDDNTTLFANKEPSTTREFATAFYLKRTPPQRLDICPVGQPSQLKGREPLHVLFGAILLLLVRALFRCSFLALADVFLEVVRAEAVHIHILIAARYAARRVLLVVIRAEAVQKGIFLAARYAARWMETEGTA